MSQNQDIERYSKDPSLLVDACREVIDRLDTLSDDAQTGIMEIQLREIAGTIERLEKAGVTVPDVLRAEKTRLAAALGIQADAAQALSQLAGEFEDILKDLKARLGVTETPTEPKKPRPKRQRTPKTDKKVLRESIIQALKTLGGRSRATAVVEEMGRLLSDKLLAGDLEWREATNEHVWQNNAKWERFRMVEDGVLKSGSPRGIWELNEEYR
jgi:hypothetical protein